MGALMTSQEVIKVDASGYTRTLADYIQM